MLMREEMAYLVRSGCLLFSMSSITDTICALVNLYVRYCTSTPVGLGSQKRNSICCRVSLLASAVSNMGCDLSISVVKVNGLCWRLPVASPVAGSRGDTRLQSKAMTWIDPTLPAWG